MNIPNLLTLLRIAAIPVIVILFYLPFSGHRIAIASIFIIAAATDWLDGYLARYWKLTSAFGAFLDPIADKLLVAVSLILIVAEHPLPYLAIPASVIVGREIVISGLREWMAEIGKRASLAVSFMAKVKTFFQMVALVLLLATSPQDVNWQAYSGYILLNISAILTLWSMIMYLKAAWPEFKLGK